MKRFIISIFFTLALVSCAFAYKLPEIKGLDRSVSVKNNSSSKVLYDVDMVSISPDSALIDNADGTVELNLYATVSGYYVPYTGAVDAVDLGTQAIITTGTATSAVVYATDSASIPRLANLPQNGFVKTGDGIGNLSIDTNTYITSATTIDVLYDRVPYEGATDSVYLASYGLQAGTIKASDSVLSVGEVHSSMDVTASGQIISAGNITSTSNINANGEIHSDSSVTSSGEVLAVSATTQVLNVYSTLVASGPIVFMDDRGGGNELGMLATHLDEENSNTLLDMSRASFSCSGGVLTYTLYAINGHGTWNFHGTIYPMSVPSASITLTGGTDLNPKTNYIYWELQSDIPTMVTAELEPTGEHIDVATVVVGAISGSNFTIYAYNRNRHEIDTFVHRVIEKSEYEGTLYKSGYVPGATAAGLTVGATGGFFNGIFELTSNNALSFDGEYYYIKSDGTFNKSTSLSDITQYSDGTAIPGNARVNVVWGVVPTSTSSRGTVPVVVRLVAVVQSKPASAYTTDLTAEQDASGATNYYPSNTEIKKIFVPVMRTIVQPGTPAFKAFTSGAFFKDIRGKITSGGGAATPVDLSSYVPYSGAIDNLSLGNYYARAFSLSSSDFVVSVGEMHSGSDVTASGSIITANSATGTVLYVSDRMEAGSQASAPVITTEVVELRVRSTPSVVTTGRMFWDGTYLRFYDGANWRYLGGWGN